MVGAMDGTDPDALLAGLNEAQAEAVLSHAAPLCIHAGAGSGKTRVLTRRIAHRIVTEQADARHVLALTFTRKAAGEMRRRLRRLQLRDNVAAGTFHAIANAQLRSRWADQGREAPTLLERKARFLVPLLPRRERQVSAMEVAGELEWASARLVAADSYPEAATAAGRRPPLPLDQIARIIDGYAERKREQRVIDFDDLLRLCIRGLETDTEFAAAQRWRFRHLFVDEFQDVNPLQFRLLKGWLGDRTDLCVVGDPNQAIYAWNGADARYLDRFDHEFPGGELVRLDDNYRSSPQILATANAVLAAGPGAPRHLRPHAPDGPVPTITAHTTDQAEAAAVARVARDLHRPGSPWSEQAVLVRTNGQAALLSEAFSTARIPHRLKGAAGLLERPEVQEALRALDRGPLEAALSDLGATAAGHVDGEEILRPGEGNPAVPRPAEADAATDPDGDDGLEQERRANIGAIVRLSREYLALEPSPTGAGMVSWIRSTLRSGDGDASRDAVDIVTFHAAKGLEWAVVHLAGLEDGLVPIGHAKTPEAKAEERRLVYVAITRAERELHCSWAERRSFGSRTSDRSASPYLTTIERVIALLDRGEEPADWRAHLEKSRRTLRADDGGRRHSERAADQDRALVEALKSWRRRAARAADVSAFVLFDDSTLEAVAAARPSSRGELIAISGVGPVKAERFGDQVLDVVRATSN
jgi:DNA helicase-2/ATP-dependent DNA helicase PcrA